MNSELQLMRTPGIALHRQVFLVLRDGIVQGTYPAGTALPTEESLVELFGVSRMTVRRALADLDREGLVQRRHGTGTFVRSSFAPGTSVATLSYVEHLRHQAQTTDVKVIAVETVAPPAWVSAALHIPHDQLAVHAIRLRTASGVPLMLTQAWIPESLGKKVTAAALQKRAMYEVLMDQGVVFGRVVQQISAESADPNKAAYLKCEVSTALIKLTRLMHDQTGRPVQHLTVHLTPQHSQILMEIPGELINTLSAGHIVHDPALLRPIDASRRASR